MRGVEGEGRGGEGREGGRKREAKGQTGGIPNRG